MIIYIPNTKILILLESMLNVYIGHVKCHPRIRLIFITAILKPVNLKKSLSFFFCHALFIKQRL